jgi:hypothetical protein
MIFLLKLLRKIIGLFVKLLLLPFRLVLRLVRGSSDDSSSEDGSMVASAATSAATAAASSAAATADEARDRQASDRQVASTTGPEQRVDPSVLTNYGRFRKALYAYAGFGALFYVFLWAEFSAPIGALLVPLAVGLGVPVALGYWARTESRLAWGAGMAYAGLFLLLSFAGVASLANLGPSATRAFNDLLGGGVVMILGALSLLQTGSLAAALYFGVTGRAVALGAATAVPEPSTDGSETAGVEDSTRDGPPAEQSTGTASAQPMGTASERTETSPADAAGTGTEPTATDTGSAPTGTTDAGTTDAEPTEASTMDAATDTGRTAAAATDAEAAAGSDDGAEGDTPPVVEGLAEEIAATRDPADIRDLGDRVDGDPVPDGVITALETCAEADDPDVRVAVCDACAEIPGDAVESILGRLRIDTNDRVATAAMEAY